jgi:hypothetical protein
LWLLSRHPDHEVLKADRFIDGLHCELQRRQKNLSLVREAGHSGRLGMPLLQS